MVGSPVHPASLVDPTLHSPALMELIDIEMSRTLIEHLVDTVIEAVDYALGRPSSSTRGRSMSRHSEQSKFLNFVSDIIYKAEVKVPVILAALVYIDRAKPHIQIALEQWANERVFLGALILANKYLNDSTLKNVHWALCTGVFGKRDIGRIEREFLDVLDFELSISESDLLAHHDALLAISHPPTHVHKHLSPRESHKHHARRTSSPFQSRWSSDSSEMDLDSVSSFDGSSLPRTPESVSTSALHYHPTTKPAEVDFSSNPHVHTDASQHQQNPHQSRMRTSALSILRSFPMPHFHAPQPHIAPQPAYHHTFAPQAMPIRA